MKSCMHRLMELSVKYRPYRYFCLECRNLLKVASGIHIPDGDFLMAQNVKIAKARAFKALKKRIEEDTSIGKL